MGYSLARYLATYTPNRNGRWYQPLRRGFCPPLPYPRCPTATQITGLVLLAFARKPRHNVTLLHFQVVADEDMPTIWCISPLERVCRLHRGVASRRQVQEGSEWETSATSPLLFLKVWFRSSRNFDTHLHTLPTEVAPMV